MTALTAAADSRIAAAAPSCYITTFYHNTMNELPVDGEQVFLRMIADGGEMADFIQAQAPRPYRILILNITDIDKLIKRYPDKFITK